MVCCSDRKCRKARRFCRRSSSALRSLHGRAPPASWPPSPLTTWHTRVSYRRLNKSPHFHIPSDHSSSPISSLTYCSHFFLRRCLSDIFPQVNSTRYVKNKKMRRFSFNKFSLHIKLAISNDT